MKDKGQQKKKRIIDQIISHLHINRKSVYLLLSINTALNVQNSESNLRKSIERIIINDKSFITFNRLDA